MQQTFTLLQVVHFSACCMQSHYQQCTFKSVVVCSAHSYLVSTRNQIEITKCSLLQVSVGYVHRVSL